MDKKVDEISKRLGMTDEQTKRFAEAWDEHMKNCIVPLTDTEMAFLQEKVAKHRRSLASKEV
jgi:hypothetical protein